MSDLLFLAHRLPYPPDKGDKIRAWPILRHLATRHRVHLGTFFDDPRDAAHVPVLEQLCASVCALPLRPLAARFRSLAALATGEAMSARYFRDRRLMAWIDETVARFRPRATFVYCSAMAPYVTGLAVERRVVDMVDLDSAKWSGYAEAGGPLASLHRREARRLLALERRAASELDATIFVSSAEAALLEPHLSPEHVARLHVMPNGVDLDHFDPNRAYPNPFPRGRRAVVFTGAMDYRPNIDAALWFGTEVVPRLRRRWSNTDFWIVGANPARALRRLGNDANIRVTGRVADVRPYLAHADAAVAPLRLARGVQNKVLEAMAMAKPLVASPAALAAFDFRRGDEVLAAATPAEFVDMIAVALSPQGRAIGARARGRVVADFRWETKLPLLDALLETEPRAVAAESLALATAS
ncbi:MAG: TIGR03087 family PEP-CTERM/XrtA system glycosyltransferase [Alphaproteobacteria bacterium]|nr:TIGR03087 family PEP-CTERM/XrtA system glycosyltransferase [Alphaproteobacteria bacterium]